MASHGESADFLDRANFSWEAVLGSTLRTSLQVPGAVGRCGDAEDWIASVESGCRENMLQHVETRCNGMNWNQQEKHWCHVERPNLKKGWQ